jgi:hypothetical protein
MKKYTITSILVLALFLFAPNQGYSQIKRLLKEKALEALQGTKVTEEKVTEEKVTEEKPTESQPKRTRQPGQNFVEQRMMQAMGLNNVKHDQRYTFTSSMVMDIETIDSLKNKEKVKYYTFFNPNDKNFAMVFDGTNASSGEKQKGTMIFDMKNYAMLILSEENGERTGVALTIPSDSASISESEEISNADMNEGFVHPLYKPTGKSKTIAGHKCNEYAYQNTDGKVSIWVAEKSKVNISKAYGQVYGLQALTSLGLGFGMGMVMEMVTTDNFSGASTHYVVNEIQENSAKTIDLSGYKIIGMGEGK